MFRIIFYKELLENIQNYRFIIALILCLTIIPLGFYVSFKDYQTKQQNYMESVKRYEENHQTIQDIFVRGAAAFRPPSPLSMLSSGVEFLLPHSAESVGYLTEKGARVRFNNDRSLGSPYPFLYGNLDLVFIVSVVLTFLAMLFIYNSIAGEKERRTLGQVLSNSVSRNTVIAAKLSANFFLLSLAFLLGILIGILILILLGFEIFSSRAIFIPFLLGVGVSLLFILAFLNIGLLISGLCKSSISSIVLLMFCWVVLFMIFPKASVIVSKIIKPVKSQQVIDMEKNQRRLQIDKEAEEEIDKLKEAVPGLKDMSIREFMKNLRAGAENVKEYIEKQNQIRELYKAKSEEELNKIDSYYEKKRNVQAALAQNISRLSPVSCFIHLMVEISSTGLVEYKQWKRTRSRFKQLLDEEICSKQDSMRFGNFSTGDFKGDRKGPAPKLVYQPVSLSTIWKYIWPDFALLLLYNILFFTGAYVVFLKYDVR